LFYINEGLNNDFRQENFILVEYICIFCEVTSDVRWSFFDLFSE